MKPKLVPSGKFYLFHVFYMAVRFNFKATVPTSKAYFEVLGLKLAGRKSHLKKLEYPHGFFFICICVLLFFICTALSFWSCFYLLFNIVQSLSIVNPHCVSISLIYLYSSVRYIVLRTTYIRTCGSARIKCFVNSLHVQTIILTCEKGADCTSFESHKSVTHFLPFTFKNTFVIKIKTDVKLILFDIEAFIS